MDLWISLQLSGIISGTAYDFVLFLQSGMLIFNLTRGPVSFQPVSFPQKICIPVLHYVLIRSHPT